MEKLKKILIVDDEVLIRKYLEKTLASYFIVSTAESFESAKCLIEEKDTYDFILCDYLMENSNGLELYDYLITKDYNLDIKNNFCFMTAYEDKEIFNKLFRTGCRIVGKSELSADLILQIFIQGYKGHNDK